MAASPLVTKTKHVKDQRFDYFLVLDFEATCDNSKKLIPQLTGILQEMVDGQPHFEETLQKFDTWMKEEVLDRDASYTFVTCGDWDLKTMLPSQCRYFKVPPKPYFQRWINIKKAFADVTGTYPRGMMPMLEMLGIPHVGRHHSGIGKV
ncbi:hypothetical protein BaRGS_00000507 [Batillaria attramentaria]|uniref:Exonuclease domain-containing protein n=1 Tax=Batillaria attramentaria TaxID=370345 RepID=A0ABD0M8X4_9CAEN